jgi:acyl-CoA thioesterase FadM
VAEAVAQAVAERVLLMDVRIIEVAIEEINKLAVQVEQQIYSVDHYTLLAAAQVADI